MIPSVDMTDNFIMLRSLFFVAGYQRVFKGLESVEFYHILFAQNGFEWGLYTCMQGSNRKYNIYAFCNKIKLRS